MPRTRAYYSIVQYMPDPGRAEGANVGVAVFSPESGSVSVRMSRSLARVQKFFTPEPTEFHRIKLAVAYLEYRLTHAQDEFRTEEGFARFVAARADSTRLTPPRLVILTDLPKDLECLYQELVGDSDPDEIATEVERTAH